MQTFAISASLLLCSFLLCYNLMTSSTLKGNINIDIDYLRHQKMNKVRRLSPCSYAIIANTPHHCFLFRKDRRCSWSTELGLGRTGSDTNLLWRWRAGYFISFPPVSLLSLLPSFSLSTLRSGQVSPPWLHFWSIYVLPRSRVSHGLQEPKPVYVDLRI